MLCVAKTRRGPALPSTSSLKSSSWMATHFPPSLHQMDLNWSLSTIFQSFCGKQRDENSLAFPALLLETAGTRLVVCPSLPCWTLRSSFIARPAASQGALSPCPGGPGEAPSSSGAARDVVSGGDGSLLIAFVPAGPKFPSLAIALDSQALSCQSASKGQLAPADCGHQRDVVTRHCDACAA